MIYSSRLKTLAFSTGAKRYGTYKGYGRGTCYLGPCTDNANWAERRILAMDAKPWIGSPLGRVSLSVSHSIMSVPKVTSKANQYKYKTSSLRSDQLKGSIMRRELEKAFAAFSLVADDKDTVIGTGHWGCGAFGGAYNESRIVAARIWVPCPCVCTSITFIRN